MTILSPRCRGIIWLLPFTRNCYGVSFTLALFNAALALLFIKRRELSSRAVWQPLAISALVVLAVLGYGLVKTGDEGTGGEKFSFALLQDDLTNEERPRSATREGNELFIDYLARTIDAAGRGADVVVWGEGTMVFLDMNQESYRPWDYELDIYALVRDQGIWLLMV